MKRRCLVWEMTREASHIQLKKWLQHFEKVTLCLGYLQEILTDFFFFTEYPLPSFFFFFSLLCKNLATVVPKLQLSYLSLSGSSLTFLSRV